MSTSLPLPAALGRLATLDPTLAQSLEEDFLRLARAGSALAWAHAHLGALLACPDEAARLGLLVELARELTGAPEVWALSWQGELLEGPVSLRFLAGDAVAAPGPHELSQSLLRRVLEEGRPVWSDDARADARFEAAESVQALSLRSVGCLPVGPRGALYLHDPDAPGRFDLDARLRLSALCRAVGALLDPASDTREPAPERLQPVAPLPGLVGGSPAMAALSRAVRAFAPLPWPVLVLGETGTGKEAVCRALHALSPRAEAPFVPVNCGAIVESLAESVLFGHERGAFTGAERRTDGLLGTVRGGTLFLDEVGELPPAVQVKLLRLLQEGRYTRVGGREELVFHGRVVAATHRELDSEAGRQGFREDLYYRLAAAVIRVPALRERTADLPDLAAHLLARASRELEAVPQLTLSEEALARLSARSWPGNVRQLENTVRHGLALALARGSASLEPQDLEEAPLRWRTAAPEGQQGSPPPAEPGPYAGASAPAAPRPRSGPAIDPDLDLPTATTRFQQARVRAALAATSGQRTAAAERLGVSRQWLHRLLRRWSEEDPAWSEGSP